MPWLHSTFKAGVFVGNLTASSGKLIRSRPTADLTPQHVEMGFPTGYQVLDRKPTSVTYRNRWYMVGHGSDNVLVDENFRVLRQGILPPIRVPVLAAGAGPGPTGSCRVRIRFYDEDTDQWSPGSGWSNTVSLANQARAVTNIQTSAEARVTHIGIEVEINGGTPRISTMRQLGVSSVTENVATLALGEALDDFERMPNGTLNAIYHERQFVAGDAHAPDVLYASNQLEPEQYAGLSFKTRNGEPIVAMIPSGLAGVLLVLTPKRPYILRGWTEDDMVFEPQPFRIGAYNAHSVIDIDGNVWIVGPQGIFLFNGAFHNMLLDRLTEWQELSKADRAIYETGFCSYDPNDTTFSFWTSGYGSSPSWIPNPDSATIKTVAWVCDYSSTQPEVSGSFTQPDWYVDVIARQVESAGNLSIPGGRRGDLYIGSCDGFSRVKDPTDGDDDSDGYDKRYWLRLPHYVMTDPGGDWGEGKTFERVWLYFESEDNAWTLYLRGGDEKAYLQKLPDNTDYWWKNDVAASELLITNDGFDTLYAPQTVHPFQPSRCSGRGLTTDLTVPHPVDIRFAGIGGLWTKGQATRGVVTRQEQG